MKRINILSIGILLMATGIFHLSCTDKDMDVKVDPAGEGTLLNLYMGVETMTRVGELTSLDDIITENNGLSNLGLYIYYSEDYDNGAGNLTLPYVKNMECTVENGKLVPVTQPGDPEANKNIYIYDKMTVVAFYPYNAEMDNVNFTVRADQEQYPITRNDYSTQTFIPYRAEATANPTNSYYVELVLLPKHTFKMEIILVSDNEADFDGNVEDIRILPDVDPVDNPDISGVNGKREMWIDRTYDQPDKGGGSNVRRYVAYLWQDSERNRVIERNDVLFQNGNFTLLATERVNVREQRTYRYGYNMSTGESFIPTSSYLINDRVSLQAASMTNNHAYQVCDIDIEGNNFNPLSLINAVYDGGGHKISNLNVSGNQAQAGLFGKIAGSSAIKNVNLVDPVITISASDTCFVGALCGRVNNRLTDAEIQSLYDTFIFPDNLSEVVKQALIKDLLQDVYNSQSQVIACRVDNPQITVTSPHPRVGTVCGGIADLDDDRTYKGVVWDTYNLGGTLAVNSGNPAANNDAFVGGFCGLNEFYITRCFTTIAAEDMDAQKTIIDNSTGTPVPTDVDIAQGFANQGTLYAGQGAGIADCYAIAPDSNAGVQQLPGAWPPSSWISYNDIWPINTSAWTSYSANSYWYNTGTQGTEDYPTLHWQRR